MSAEIPMKQASDDPITEVLSIAAQRWAPILAAGLACAAIGVGASFTLKPTFTARASFIAPQPSQGGAAMAAISSLGALSSLAGASVKSSTDQYVSLMESVSVGTQLIKQFDLARIYESKLASDALRELKGNTRIAVGKKDGLITVEFDDHDPQRAANVANAYIAALKSMTDKLALTEAQQRRIFFEQQMVSTKSRLTQAQIDLESSGITAGALKAEPKAASEALARLSAELTAAEVRLEAMRRSLAEGAIELQRQQALVGELRNQIRRAETSQPTAKDSDYVSRYREFKYQETLFDILSRQFELAKLDEAREATLVQVIDAAVAPDRKSKPKRAYFAAAFFALGIVGATLAFWQRSRRALQSQ